jgi:hypothetical protein
MAVTYENPQLTSAPTAHLTDAIRRLSGFAIDVPAAMDAARNLAGFASLLVRLEAADDAILDSTTEQADLCSIRSR